MKIFNKTGIFSDTVEPTQDAPGASEAQVNLPEPAQGASEQVSELERAKNAIKRANEAIQAGKPKEEAKEPNAYEQYVALQLENPTEAGIYWRANKPAIYACIEH